MGKSLNYLLNSSNIYAEYGHDRVHVEIILKTGEKREMSFLGVLHSEFSSGPNMCILADAAAEIVEGVTGVCFKGSRLVTYQNRQNKN